MRVQLINPRPPLKLVYEDKILLLQQPVKILRLSPNGLQGAKGDSGGIASDAFVFGEVVTGAINGSNATFTSQYNFVPESVSVYVNGIRQKIIDDYQTTGTQTIVLTVSPVSGEKVLIDYLRSS